MNKIPQILLLIVAAALFANAYTIEESFDKWMQKYQKSYPNEVEKNLRMDIWKNTILKNAKLTEAARKKGLNTQFSLNRFSDLTAQEFDSQYKGYHKNLKSAKRMNKADSFDSSFAIPATYDWRNNNPPVVTAVKDQMQCGSCWAFSATEGVECAWALSGQKLVSLAPQQIVDCDTGDMGCEGGDLPTAFAYVQANGLELESTYPYDGEQGTCAYNPSAVVARISGFQYATTTGNETQMQVALLKNGPLSICVDAETWQSYSGGIITNNCPDNLDHCVQIVGFSVSGNTPYWIIRNSWGTSWGIDGYIYVERNEDLCGVSDEATYVTIK